MRKQLIFIILSTFTLYVAAFGRFVSEPMSKEAIKERIMPVGQVEVVGGLPEEPVDNVSVGEQVYNKYCSACHASGIAGAPKKGSNAWKVRLAKGEQALLNSVVNGLGAMPPMGTCSSCTEEDLSLAIEHMLPK